MKLVTPVTGAPTIPTVDSDFNGRTILVTGASGGIGGATVRQLVAAGADVIASGRSAEALEAARGGDRRQALPFDLTSETASATPWTASTSTGWSTAAASAARSPPRWTPTSTVFDKVIMINTRGALLVTKYTARSMIRLGRGGAIVNVSSQASLVALSGHISYGSSKAALDNITRVSALELGRYNIRVNSVNPTVVMTPMSAWYWGRTDIQGPFLDQMPLGRWATEAEIAAPIVFLLSDGASMITGVSLPIDGGYTSQ